MFFTTHRRRTTLSSSSSAEKKSPWDILRGQQHPALHQTHLLWKLSPPHFQKRSLSRYTHCHGGGGKGTDLPSFLPLTADGAAEGGRTIALTQQKVLYGEEGKKKSYF